MTDWRQRYLDGHTPWDLGGPHPELVRRLAAGELEPPRAGAWALVPGCGRGWDALALAEAGWRVLAVDLVPDLAELIADRLEAAGGAFLVADALDPACLAQAGPGPGGFDLFLDHTFFCAIPLERRPDFGRLAAAALGPDGCLCSLVFPVGRPTEQGGPPFAMSPADLAAALGPDFAAECDIPATARGAGRAWEERWCRFSPAADPASR
jgi:SAM-dependent methyltransferase